MHDFNHRITSNMTSTYLLLFTSIIGTCNGEVIRISSTHLLTSESPCTEIKPKITSESPNYMAGPREENDIIIVATNNSCEKVSFKWSDDFDVKGDSEECNDRGKTDYIRIAQVCIKLL